MEWSIELYRVLQFIKLAANGIFFSWNIVQISWSIAGLDNQIVVDIRQNGWKLTLLRLLNPAVGFGNPFSIGINESNELNSTGVIIFLAEPY